MRDICSNFSPIIVFRRLLRVVACIFLSGNTEDSCDRIEIMEEDATPVMLCRESAPFPAIMTLKREENRRKKCQVRHRRCMSTPVE